MTKWMQQLDSAHQTGLKPTLQEILIVVESGDTGSHECQNIDWPSGKISIMQRSSSIVAAEYFYALPDISI